MIAVLKGLGTLVFLVTLPLWFLPFMAFGIFGWIFTHCYDRLWDADTNDWWDRKFFR
jgi:hypothetical protein